MDKICLSLSLQRMSLHTQRQGQLGVNAIERTILSTWQSRWQPFDAHNDDGVDGLIFLETGGELSGQVIFVQVKCVKAKRRKDGKFCVPVERKQLERNLLAWRKVVGAAILVLVDPDTFAARWVNLKDREAFTPTQVLVPHHQIFNETAKHEVEKLCGTMYRDLQAQPVHTVADDFPHLRGKSHLQIASRALYQSFQREPVQIGVVGPLVVFDREGWRHITRPSRSQLTRYQSFVLLGTARKIIEGADTSLIFRATLTQKGEESSVATIRAMVTFPFRQTGLVKVLLKKTQTDVTQPDKIKFWTIYEPRRKMNAVGVQEPRRL